VADSDAVLQPDLEKVARAWPHLPPHIREAILTLVAGTLDQLDSEGGRK
jgi:hypothetical protein